MANIGICGAHRTGKTTLAIALSEALKIPFVPINASDIFTRLKLRSSQSMDIRSRLFVQQEILTEAKSIWLEMEQPFICDRTPIDMAAYLLADVQNGELDTDTQEEVMEYLADCYWVTKTCFPKLVLVPPAIALIADPTKGAINRPLIHSLHCSMVGLLQDAGLGYQLLPKLCVEIGDRVDYVSGYWNQK